MILLKSIAALIPTCSWGRPAPAYGEAEDPPVPLTTPADQPGLTTFPEIPAAPGDEAPQWEHLEKKYGGDKPPTETIPAAPDPEVTKKDDPKPKDKAAEPPAKAPDKPTGPPKDTKPPEATKPPADQTKPPAKDAPKPLDPDAALKEADQVQVKPNASTATKEGFEKLRGIVKESLGEVKTLRSKVTELEGQAGKLTPEVEAELKELREFREVWGAENDPKFNEEFNTRLTAAEDKFLKTLVEDNALQLPQADADALKKAGFDSEEGQDMLNSILNSVQKTGNVLLYERVRNLVLDRNKVADERAAKLEELKGKQGGFLEAQTERQKAEQEEWAKGVNGKMQELFKDAQWGHYREIPADATPEAKAEAEAHNKRLKDEVVPAIQKALGASYARDPEQIAEHIFRSFALNEAEKERDALKADLAAAQARVAELEQTAGAVRQVSQLASRDAAPPVKPTASASSDMGAEAAIDAFLASKK